MQETTEGVLRRIFYLVLFFVPFYSYPADIHEQFEKHKILTYRIYFNGINSGYIQWQYKGVRKIKGKDADTLFLTARTKILKLLSLASEEKVFLDTNTHLPLRVERKVLFFGKRENIREEYNQEKGYVVISKSNSKSKRTKINKTPPINNILALLYFFPEKENIETGKVFYYNLPLQKIRIEVLKENSLNYQGTKRSAYLLSGKGKRNFRLWLDKKSKTPLKIEFPLLVGKITIYRQN